MSVTGKRLPGSLVCSFDAHQTIGGREEQEDRVLAMPEIGLYAVADGLGGHERGAEAAQTAMDAIRSHATALLSADRVRSLFSTAHRDVARMVRCPVTGERGKHKTSCCRRLPATTLSLLWMDDAGYGLIGHVGDTRIWRIARGAAQLLTTDHTSFGGLDRCVGGQFEDEPDVTEIDVSAGDVFILCSDGVRLTGPQIVSVLEAGASETASLQIVDEGVRQYALVRPVPDNASALVVRVEAAA